MEEKETKKVEQPKKLSDEEIQLSLDELRINLKYLSDLIHYANDTNILINKHLYRVLKGEQIPNEPNFPLEKDKMHIPHVQNSKSL